MTSPWLGKPDFEEVAKYCADITNEKMVHRPGPIVSEGTTAGSIVTIQGSYASQQQVAVTWRNAAPAEWAVITPAGGEPTPEGEWGWPHSLELSADRVLGDLQGVRLSPPVVLAGFSIGAAIASHIINATDQQVDGLIAVAPSSASGFTELVDGASTTPTLIIGGKKDSRAAHYERLQSELAHLDHVVFQIVEGLGHANPSDLEERVTSFLRQF